MDLYDVLIVGAGPAGASAALAARRGGATVALLDRYAFPRDKACGDGVAPHALDVLRDLGVPDVTAGFPPVRALRLVSPGQEVVARPLARPAHTIPRTTLDARIVEAAVSAGARLVRHAVRRIDVRRDLVVVDGAFAGRTLIGADGANSVVRRALGERPNGGRHLALAIRGYANTAPGPAEQRIVTSSELWPAYAWSFPIEPGRSNVGYGEIVAGRTLTRSHLIDQLGRLLPELDVEAVQDLRAHHLPLSTERPRVGRGRVMLAGDALSLINPFTGEGIYYAVLSGALAGAAAAAAHRDGTPDTAAGRYAARFRHRLGRHLRHSGAAARLGQRAWVVDGAVRAARDDPAVFDRLVALGLGDGRLDLRTAVRIGRGVTSRAVAVRR